MTEKKEIKRCPKCGYPDVYIGAWKIECGYVKSCSNWTQRQSDEVDRLHLEHYPEPSGSDEEDAEQSKAKTQASKTTKNGTTSLQSAYANGNAVQLDFDYDDDQDTPIWPYYDYQTDYHTD